MDFINLPQDIIHHIKDLIPRDRDMSHPTAVLLRNPFAWYHLCQQKYKHPHIEPPTIHQFVRGMPRAIYTYHPDEDTSDEDD